MSRHIEPGFCIVERSGSVEFQSRMLFRDPYSPAARYFREINADTPRLQPGQIMIIADPDSPSTLHMLHTLRQAKRDTNMALIGVGGDTSGFLHKNYGTIAALTSLGDKVFGTVSDTGERYFKEIERTLKQIETTYQNQYRAQGTLTSQPFFSERARLLRQLEEMVNKPLLKSLARHTIKFRPYDDMRRALGLSSRSIVHHWAAAGVAGIPGYATYTAKAAKIASFLKKGGYIGIAFGFSGVTNDVINACITGRETECGKLAFKEYVKFAGATTGGIWGGGAGAVIGGGICVGLGIITAPAAGAGGLACAVVGSLSAGYIGSAVGEHVADILLKD